MQDARRELKARLEQRKTDLQNEDARLLHDLAAVNQLLPDPADQASQLCDSHLILSRRERVRSALTEVERALDKIHSDSYGTCMSCNERIGLRRLLARPDTEHCIDCQERFELRGTIRSSGSFANTKAAALLPESSSEISP